MTTSAHSKGNTAGQHSFSQIPKAEIQRSAFDRSCGLKTTFAAGDLIPIFVDEALPGDTISLRMNQIVREATLVFPIMDNQFVDFFFFAVPNRLLWSNWEKFNGAQDDPGDSTDFVIPIVTTPVGGYAEGSLFDYMGIPPGIDNLDQSALFSRAANMIWNDWFRDENLQDSIVVDIGDGPDTDTDYVVMKRGKRKDYFTSCLPWPQKGPAVELPLGTSAPVSIPALAIVSTGDGIPEWTFDDVTDDALRVESDAGQAVVSTTSPTSEADLEWGTDPKLVTVAQPTGGLADLSNATAATINQLRQAFQIQRLYERDARGGTRYTEIVRSHFGISSPDARLQRPEYLGGGTTRISVNPVSQTVVGSTGVGTLAGYAVSENTPVGFNKSFTEHCVILGFAATRADLNYQQGLPRMFSRSTRWDFFWPALAHLGEQAVLNKEIWADGSANDALVFGYQERFAEYRYKASHTTAEMRSTAALPLDAWHLAQDFATLPVLGDTFIQENPPMDRILFVSGATEFLMDAYFTFKHARPMPTYSVPGMIDHF